MKSNKIIYVIYNILIILIFNYSANAGNLKLINIIAEYKFQLWKPTDIDEARYETKGINVANFEINFFKDTYLGKKLGIYPQFRYEWTPDVSLEQKQLIKINGSNYFSWQRYLFNLLLAKIGSKKGFINSLKLGYDEQVFTSKVTSKINRYYNQQEIHAGDVISSMTRFQMYKLGLHSDFDSKGNRMMDMGLTYIHYRKPYAKTISGIQQDDTIHNTKFAVYGFYSNIYSYEKKYDLELSTCFGFSSIKFSNNESLKLPKGNSAAYLDFNIIYKRKYELSEYIDFKLTLSGMFRYFIQVYSDEERTRVRINFSETDLNNDFIYSAFAGLYVKI